MKKISLAILTLLLPFSAFSAVTTYSTSTPSGNYSESITSSNGYVVSGNNTVTYGAGMPNQYIIGYGRNPRCRSMVNNSLHFGEVLAEYCHMIVYGQPIAVDSYEVLDQYGRWHYVQPLRRAQRNRHHFKYHRNNDGTGFNVTFTIR